MDRVFAILRNASKCGMDVAMNHSENHVPFVQVSTSWNGRERAYAASTSVRSRRRAMFSIAVGALLGLAIDICLFDESLVTMLARLFAN